MITQDNWSSGRKDLIKELESHFDDYSRLYENDDMVHELIHSLSHFDGSTSREYWMTMPDMGHVIASRYKVILIHLSQQQCLTFLPLWNELLAITSHKIVATGFVNDCHFVLVNGHTRRPMPPITCNWYKYHHPCAEGWATPYHARTQFF
ncbi:uncharacterized protein LOC111412905 [Olea europaea var. sylvestris]|uniref:uncharacterized protein LOC111412905 n=1 Tax=Olea europaea var. sylvestris TaxID=158386 RepID=UPI000C1D248D|nr:uncharacterized protein LOC111412905 [Olea europaea var. sylvestris]